MAEENPSQRVDPHQVAEIVVSYLRHHQVPTDQLTALIIEVHGALAGLGRAPPKQAPPRPAVPIRRSVQQDYVVCLECGFRAQMLRRHLGVAHGLNVTDYRIRWNLPADYPVTAPSYSMQRSAMAKAMRFGRRRATREPSPPATERPTARRRGRRPAPADDISSPRVLLAVSLTYGAVFYI
jgi:predicted transcriptional regulator